MSVEELVQEVSAVVAGQVNICGRVMTLDVVMGVFVWLLGLCVGSFLNVVIYRLPAGLSINRPRRSFCPALPPADRVA